ncbi:MAG: HlyD family secretion protein [Bacteroides sp.]|nr:HlyD family secretion protein [Bacteroides sp.]
MEEIYKPDPEKVSQVELYTRENHDMLGDPPHWLIHTGSYVVYGLIAFLITGSALFSYPDMVKQSITIDDIANVEWITANTSGTLDRFFVENESQVEAGDTLGILKNTAALEDVKEFCKLLTKVEWYYRTNDPSELREYPFNLIMGEMAGAYEQFTQAVRTCMIFQEFDLYPEKKKYLQEELSILEQSRESSELSLLKVKRELFELEMDHKMEMARNRRMLELAYENMVNQLQTWENRYLIKTKNPGTVIWGKSWSMSKFVNEGDTICSVMSGREGHPVGHIRLSQHDVAEIAPGNKVNIELAQYPAHTYGYLVGEVSSVSYVPYNRSYAVEIALPADLMTTARKQISYEVGLSGNAEIITSSRSILNRIFTPIYQLLKQK